MKVALYVGDHRKDSLLTRLGWWVTRATQRGDYRDVTHAEAIHEEHANGDVTIASATLRDGGVRRKRVRLNASNWLIADVPMWDVERSMQLYELTAGAPYDWRGALATRIPWRHKQDEWFCNEWVAAPFLHSPETFGPSQFAALSMSIGTDVTAQFFQERKE